MLVLDMLDFVGGAPLAWESDVTRWPNRLTLGIGDPLVGMGSWVLSLDSVCTHCALVLW